MKKTNVTLIQNTIAIFNNVVAPFENKDNGKKEYRYQFLVKKDEPSFVAFLEDVKTLYAEEAKKNAPKTLSTIMASYEVDDKLSGLTIDGDSNDDYYFVRANQKLIDLGLPVVNSDKNKVELDTDFNRGTVLNIALKGLFYNMNGKCGISLSVGAIQTTDLVNKNIGGMQTSSKSDIDVFSKSANSSNELDVFK